MDSTLNLLYHQILFYIILIVLFYFQSG